VKKINSVQDWLPFEDILNNGIIKLKDSSLVKVIKVIPINFNLKSNLEKEAILNSYKIFLKTCSFNIQILIQSNKEDLSKHISKVKEQNTKENKNIIKISKDYINFIQEINKEKKSASKNFYILIKENNDNVKTKNDEKIIIEKLNDNFFNIKECLSRCGNVVYEINERDEVKKIIYSFLNVRKELFLL
jgi:conjugal transfer ATP-binding protein TraC